MIRPILTSFALGLTMMSAAAPAMAGDSTTVFIEPFDERERKAIQTATGAYEIKGKRGNQASVEQNGRRNAAAVGQRGRGNGTRIVQNGCRNKATVTQDGRRNGLGVVQFGCGGDVAVNQSGRDNAGYVLVFGSKN